MICICEASVSNPKVFAEGSLPTLESPKPSELRERPESTERAAQVKLGLLDAPRQGKAHTGRQGGRAFECQR